jgi:hypothetical protein
VRRKGGNDVKLMFSVGIGISKREKPYIEDEQAEFVRTTSVPLTNSVLSFLSHKLNLHSNYTSI